MECRRVIKGIERRFVERFKYNKNTTKHSEKDMDLNGYKIRPSKHIITTWMRKWDADIDTLRKYLTEAQRIEKVGKYKYEAFTRIKGKSRKLIFIKNDETKEVLIITGAEGK